MSGLLLQNSLLVGGLATLLAAALGLLVAVALLGLPARWRRVGLAGAATVLALPPFLVTNCWMALLGLNGLWRAWAPLNLYSLPGVVLLLGLMLWPLTTFAAWAAWRRLEAPLLEAEPALRGARLFRFLLWPAARPLLAPAWALTGVLALNNFAVPVLLQVSVLPAEVWLRFNTHLDAAGAFVAGIPLTLAPLLLLLWLWRREVGWPRREGALPSAALRSRLGGMWPAALVGAAAVFFFALFLPVGEILFRRETWSAFAAAVVTGGRAAGATLLYAGGAATGVLLAGTWLRHRRFGWAAWLLTLTPGILLGLGLLVALNRPPFLSFARGPGIVLLALGLRYFAVGFTGAWLAARACDADLIDAARLEGASRLALWRRVRGPQMAAPLAAAWYVVYLLCLGDVETVILLTPPGGETLPMVVFNLLHYGHNAQVNALCLTLLGLALLPGGLWLAGRGLWRMGVLRNRASVGALLAAAAWVGLGTGCGEAPPTGDFAASAPLNSRFFSRVEVLGRRGAGPGEFNKPRSLAVDRGDHLFVVDLTGRIQKFGPDGAFLLSWQMPETKLGRPKGMALDGDGNLIVVEPHYARVNHFTTDGRLVRQWGTRGTNVGQINFPRAVAVARDGDLYLSEYSRAERVQRFSPDGKEVRFVIGHAGAGPGEFNRAEGLCVDAEDRLYVADSCNHRVQVFNPDGTFLRQFGRAGAAPGELSYPYDVRVDAAGHVFVCEFGNSRIQVFDVEGRSLEIIGGPGFAPGQFNNPWSLAMDSAGNLYVADAANHRVQKLIRRPRHASETEGEHTRPRVCRLAPPPIAPRARIPRPPRSAEHAFPPRNSIFPEDPAPVAHRALSGVRRGAEPHTRGRVCSPVQMIAWGKNGDGNQSRSQQNNPPLVAQTVSLPFRGVARCEASIPPAAWPPQQPRTPSRPLKNPATPRSAGFQPAVSPTSSRPSARIPRPPRSAKHVLASRSGIFPMVSAAFRPLPAPLAFRS